MLHWKLRGGIVLTNCIMTSVKHDNNSITANTTCGTIHANMLIYAEDTIGEVATGILPVLPIAATMQHSHSKMARTLTALHMICPQPSHAFSTYTIDGQQYIVATGFEYNGNDDFIDAFASLEKYLHKYFKVDQVTHRWLSQCYTGVDGLPYAGLLPGHNNEYIISCAGNNAIVYGSISAR